MVDDVVVNDVSKIDERRIKHKKFHVLSVFGFGKYPSTDIFYDNGFESKNIGRLELHPESVFRFGIGRYFFGMWLTDTSGAATLVMCSFCLFHCRRFGIGKKGRLY